MMLENSKKTIITLTIILLLIIGNEMVQYIKDPYERWADQLMSPSIEVVSIAISSALDMNDPRVVELLRKAWLDEKQIIHSKLYNHPLLKLKLANALYYLTDDHDKEYFEFIVNQLESENVAVKSSAILHLALNPSNSTVDILENIIVNEKSISRKNAIRSLASIALRNPYALNLMEKLVTAKGIEGTAGEKQLKQEVDKVKKINQR